jgi:nicotinate phosphoribosyltransferase
MIQSILDTDLYKLTMQQAVLEQYPNAIAEYRFTNRGEHRFSELFGARLSVLLAAMEKLALSKDEKTFLSELGFFKPQYLEYLQNYRFDSQQVSISMAQPKKTPRLLVVEMGYPEELIEFDTWDEADKYEMAFSDGTNYECSGRHCVALEAALSDKDWYDNEYKVDYMPEFEVFKKRTESFLSRKDALSTGEEGDSRLEIVIRGPWHQTILWEVPLMALISELYFRPTLEGFPKVDLTAVTALAQTKGMRLVECSPTQAGCAFADFGTRRRRSFAVHNAVIEGLKDACIGTSNVYLAMKHGLKPIGTMAHEWIMGISALESLRHANRFALRKWKEVYKANLGIALTDTFGTPVFWDDFDLELAKVYDGIRHDSGDPIEFAKAASSHYEKLGINPESKTIIFSDGLTVDKAREIRKKLPNMRIAFGIGTHLTNDFKEPALNMVIKLRSIDGIPVIKLSDEPGKETGDNQAVEVAKWTFNKG